MQRMASALSSRDSADLAAYFSMLPTTPDAQFNPSFPQSMHDTSCQLDDFASDNRTNDIDLPMRTIASQMHQNERQAVAEFYGAGLGRLAVGYSIGK